MSTAKTVTYDVSVVSGSFLVAATNSICSCDNDNHYPVEEQPEEKGDTVALLIYGI